MDYEHPGLCLVVLATGCRRPARTRVAGRTYRRSIPFSTDDSRSASQARDGRAMLESRFCGLSLPCLQYQYRIFTNGLSSLVNVGQTTHDGSIAHFPDHGSPVGRSRSKYSLASALDSKLLRGRVSHLRLITFSRGHRHRVGRQLVLVSLAEPHPEEPIDQ